MVSGTQLHPVPEPMKKLVLVRTTVALRVNLQGGPGRRGYPSSLVGQ